MKKWFIPILVVFALVLSACGTVSSSLASSSEEMAGASDIDSSAITGASIASQPAVSEDGGDASSVPFDSQSMWQPPYPDALVGNWHAAYMVPAMYTDRYVFEDTGVFYFSHNQMDGGERLRYMDGEWSYEDGVLHLVVMRKIIIEGGEVVDGYGSRIGAIEGGTVTKIELPPEQYEYSDYPVAIANYDEPEWLPSDSAGEEDDYLKYVRNIPSVTIGEMRFWKLASAGYDDMPEQWEADELYPYT